MFQASFKHTQRQVNHPRRVAALRAAITIHCYHSDLYSELVSVRNVRANIVCVVPIVSENLRAVLLCGFLQRALSSSLCLLGCGAHRGPREGLNRLVPRAELEDEKRTYTKEDFNDFRGTRAL